MRRPYVPVIAIPLDGWVVLLLLGLLAGAAMAQGASLLAVLLLAAIVPCVYGFADRDREVLSRPRGVLAPIDGEVIHRRECFDPVLEREAIRLVLRVDFWGGYCFRAPLEGSVEPLPSDRSRAASLIQTDEGERLVVRVTRGWLLGARPVWMPYGERVGQGRRCGVRRLAREVELLLPAEARVEVELGQQVRSGQTLLATMLRKTA